MKNIKMVDKRGAGILAVILTVLGVVFLFSAIIFFVNQSTVKPGEELEQTQNCAVEPYLDITVRNASVLSQTSGSATFQYGQNMKVLGTLTSGSSGTALRLGETYDLIASEGSHLDKIVKDVTIKNCGANPLTIDMWRSDGGNITVYSSAGTALSDDSGGGATNQSSITAGTSRNMKIEISSLGDQSINPTWFTIEIWNKTQVQDIRLSAVSPGLTVEDKGRSLLAGVSNENSTTTGYIEVFRVSGLPDNGAVATLTLTVEAHPSYAIDYCSVYVNGYSEQAFADIDGTFITGIEDSDSTAKYGDAYTDFDFIIT